MEVLGCLRRGLSNVDIGMALGISPETAITHVKALMQKLKAANRTEVVTIGYEMGLLRVEGDRW
jgi:DNA-binding NarL/FixJ family response regulator